MLATIQGNLDITIYKNDLDADDLDKLSFLSGTVLGKWDCGLELHIVDEVMKREPLEEPGFHIEISRRGDGRNWREDCSSIMVYFARHHLEEIVGNHTTEEYGCFMSRCQYDRVSIRYEGLLRSPDLELLRRESLDY